MEDKLYTGNYAVGIKLTSKVHLDLRYKNRVQTGELEKIITQHAEGVLGFHKGIGGYQNVVVFNNFNDAFGFIKTVNSLPYVHSANLIKDDLRHAEGYLPVL